MEQITIEELDDLNRAAEIISKYANNGAISSSDFRSFEELVNTIIDYGFDMDSYEDLFITEPYQDGCSITKYTGSCIKYIRVPSTINGKSVISIEREAFRDADCISVEIPHGVQSIGKHCFYGCSELRSVKLPATLKAICDSAFGFTALQTIELPDSVFYLGEDVFSESELNCVILSKSLFEIPDSAFSQCKKLFRVNIPEGIKKIGYAAFSGCKNLCEVTLPSTITEICGVAFRDCVNLRMLFIPPSVKQIGNNVFSKSHVDLKARSISYTNLNILIGSVRSSYAYQYASEYGLVTFDVSPKPMVKLILEAPLYDNPKNAPSWYYFEKQIEKILSSVPCEWVRLDDCILASRHNYCVKTNDLSFINKLKDMEMCVKICEDD